MPITPDLACFLPKYAFPAGHPIERPDLGFTSQASQAGSAGDCHAEKLGEKAEQSDALLNLEGRPVRQSEPTEAQARSRQRKPTAPLNPFAPDKPLLPAYNPPKESFVDMLPFLSIFRSAWKVCHLPPPASI